MKLYLLVSLCSPRLVTAVWHIVFFWIILLLGSAAYAATVPVLAVPSGWSAPGQEQAKLRALVQVPLVEQVQHEGAIRRSQRVRALGVSIKDVKNTYMVLDSPIIKAQEDNYAAVRFNHGQHAAMSGDCTVCHHQRPVNNPDKKAHKELVRCSACHQRSFNPEFPERLGLKAAYHQSCMPCHQQKNKGPVTCRGCHLNNVPDHKKLVKLGEKPDALQVTAECLRCHQQDADHVLHSAHWLWRGPSSYTIDHERDISHGKGTTALNNY